ncbi:MAG: hypothetical protein UY27_C0023G0011 [Candidatus Gottesmanbacteria bacterium GW2011_GWA1_48_13]|uniref:Uncharacterized protein n=1 Tax=Candidatus Gottesmanbacteria bacterium GW2011_GWA1_48_13 TaxID=1618439 RepID=A0A0G1WYA9_9BACT|nr:MAG: hypothetical protein UY27_C0023G0011 [Candidatus Gottesmanbacteria bacterium GW2011_GWA1_48_13]
MIKIDPNSLVDIIRNLTLFGVIKGFFVVGLVMYVAFSLVIVRQIKSMTEAVEDEFNGLISILAWMHLLLAIGVMVLAIVVL